MREERGGRRYKVCLGNAGVWETAGGQRQRWSGRERGREVVIQGTKIRGEVFEGEVPGMKARAWQI